MGADDQRLHVAVVDARGRPLRAPGLARWLTRAAPPTARGQVTVAVVSDARVRGLNRTYRGIDKATDVLSFPSPGSVVRPPKSDARGPEAFLGDIAIARGVARRQARAQGHSEGAEWRVLSLHGLLHLLGYDHETDRGEMRRLEQRLLARAGRAAGLIARESRAR
jgi:probable rRNA maturation factor